MTYLYYIWQALKLTKSAAVDGLNGQVINLMSNDVARFDVTMGFVHDLWKGPVELVLMGYFIYREIGYYGLTGIGFLMCFLPIQSKVHVLGDEIRAQIPNTVMFL